MSMAAAVAGPHAGRLTIDLGALQLNYRKLAEMAAPAECAAAVKGDAYGLGLEQVSRALASAGCRTFFVAHLSEAAGLRGHLGDAPVIYVLNGLLPGTAPLYGSVSARPVLGSLEEISEWQSFCRNAEAAPAAIMVDTGFNRLGLSDGELDILKADLARLEGIDVALVQSHLACADEAQNPLNADQLARFEKARELFPNVPASLANSGGVLMDKSFHFELVRPGIALFGGRAAAGSETPMRPVVSLDVPVIQVRAVPAGETIGYGASYRFENAAKVALLSLGYADGFFRCLSGATGKPGGQVYFGDHPAPIVGRISMDVTAVDVTRISDELTVRGSWAEVMGPHQSAAALAADAGTIDYEVFTSLGSRYERIYSAPAESFP